jgi:hypothetical protein
MIGKKVAVLAVLALPLLLGATRASAQPAYKHALSSGLFSLPSGAHSVDWALVNDSAVSQNVRVTVFRHGIGVPRVAVAPGPIALTLASTETTHNANSVGGGQPFVPGFYYEVIVETDSLRVLPVVHVWEDAGNTVIPGTAIPAGSWVTLR